jgi:ABC-type bacteriocin/lantibiotic exporter with double-glycine peptidase domain
MNKRDKMSYHRLLRLTAKSKMKYLLLAALVFFISIFPILIGIQVRQGIDVAVNHQEGSLIFVFFVFFGIVILNAICFRFRRPLWELLSIQNGESLLMLVYEKIYRLPQLQWDRLEKGGVFTLLESDLHIMREHLPKYLLPMTIESLGIVFGYVSIFIFSPTLFLIAVLAGVPLIVLIIIFSMKIEKNAMKLQGNTEQLNTYFDEAFHSLDILKLFKAQSYSEGLYKKYFMKRKASAVKNKALSGGLEGLSNFVVLFSGAAVLIAGAYLVKEGQISFGELAAVCTILEGAILWPLTRMPEDLAILFQQKASFTRCADFLNLEEESVKRHNPLKDPEMLSIKNVSYAYSENKVLQDISLNCKKGEIILIKGASGSGKTTLMKLLLGLYQPLDGKICLERGNQTSGVAFRSIAYVPQGNFVIEGLSLSENIQMSDDKGDLELATRLAGVSEFSSEMQYGLSTIADASRGFSKSQMQRVAIGRALYKNADFMIMDEPFSALDERNIIQIKKNLKELSKDKGIIVISHRGIDDFADRIYTLERGRIV